jgi:GntR family transcriptional regulator
LLLERNNPLPMYEQLKNIIAAQINKGELEPDQQIPSERELCEVYGVSRITVRQAIAAAVNEGLLYRTHGRGTFVSNSKIEQTLSTVNNFQQTLIKQGFIASTQLLKSEFVPNNFLLSRILNVELMEQIININLLGFGNDVPVVFYDSYFPKEIGQKIMEEAKKASDKNIPFSTLDLYGKKTGYVPTHVEQTFEAVAPDETVAGILKINPNSPILLVTSIVYNGEKTLEYKCAYYRGDKYKFFVTRDFNSL